MYEFLQSGVFCVALTLGAYRIGLLCQKKFRTPLCNPILIAVVLVLLFLRLTGLEAGTYKAATGAISWLMTPATVCLAIPMYDRFEILRKNIRALLAGIAAGAVGCLCMVLLGCVIAGFDRSLTISLLPKSVTSAIGVPLSELSGGIPSISTAAIILTGIMASVFGQQLCKWFRITDPVAQGVAFGTAGHVIGTTKAGEMSEVAGAVSSLALVVAGLLTATVFPLITALIP